MTLRFSPPRLLDLTKSNTKRTQQHEACSCSYIVMRCDSQTGAPVEYRGLGAAEHFLKALQEEAYKIKGKLADPQAMRMTREYLRTHNAATTCRICLQDLAGDSARDHCDITGKYRGAAHGACNLKLRLHPKSCRSFYTICTATTLTCISKMEVNVSCIPNNIEKYISSLRQLRFIDSA